jgi:hypothetical protein
LTITADPAPKATPAAVASTAPAAAAPAVERIPQPKPAHKTQQYIALGFIFLAGCYVMFGMGKGASAQTAGADLERTLKALDGIPPGHSQAAAGQHIKKTISKAAFRESGPDPAAAKELYLQARRQIANARKAGAPDSALDPAEEFVLTRLQGLPTTAK